MVSRTHDGDVFPTHHEPEISLNAIAAWLSVATELTLDGIRKPSAEAVAQRLRSFWLQDEAVLYVGKADVPLKDRVSQLYQHRLGKRSPHRGGHWLKALGNLHQLFIFFAAAESPSEVENSLLSYFSRRTSSIARESLWDKEKPVPFANLRRHDGSNKNHGFAKQVR